MQISERSAARSRSPAPELGVASSARAAASAKRPPEPIAATPSSRLNHVSVAREDQRALPSATTRSASSRRKQLIGAPVLGQLHRRARQVPGVLLELALEPLEERERVGGGPRESGDDAPVAEAPQLLGPVLHHRLSSVTWPSAAITVVPPRRTHSTVVIRTLRPSARLSGCALRPCFLEILRTVQYIAATQATGCSQSHGFHFGKLQSAVSHSRQAARCAILFLAAT